MSVATDRSHTAMPVYFPSGEGDL